MLAATLVRRYTSLKHEFTPTEREEIIRFMWAAMLSPELDDGRAVALVRLVTSLIRLVYRMCVLRLCVYV